MSLKRKKNVAMGLKGFDNTTHPERAAAQHADPQNHGV